ncbi:hypothetical protein [uncultured Gammaproteobacteria bacterium]|nr:hypothetical protein [uncultured Gammaproteobacteria bacterium]
MIFVLIGSTSNGKTTLGRALSKRLNLNLIDSDELLENTLGMSIGCVFSDKGINYVNLVTLDILKNFSQNIEPNENYILVAGASCVMSIEIVNLLKKISDYIVCIESKPLTQINRIKQNKHASTSLITFLPNNNLAEIYLTYRKHFNYIANILITTDDLSIKETSNIVEKIIKGKNIW